MSRDAAVSALANWMPAEEAEVICDWWVEAGSPFKLWPLPSDGTLILPETVWAAPWCAWQRTRLMDLARESCFLSPGEEPLVAAVFAALDQTPPDRMVLGDLEYRCFRQQIDRARAEPFVYLRRLAYLGLAKPSNLPKVFQRRWEEWGVPPATFQENTRWQWAALDALVAWQNWLSCSRRTR